MTTLEEARRLRVEAEIAIMDVLKKLSTDTGCRLNPQIQVVANTGVGVGTRYVYVADIEVVL